MATWRHKKFQVYKKEKTYSPLEPHIFYFFIMGGGRFSYPEGSSFKSLRI